MTSLRTHYILHELLSTNSSLLTILPTTYRCATHHYKKRACPTYVSTPFNYLKDYTGDAMKLRVK